MSYYVTEATAKLIVEALGGTYVPNGSGRLYMSDDAGQQILAAILAAAGGSTPTFEGSIAAAGNNQATARAVTKDVNYITTGANGTGVRLDGTKANGQRQTLVFGNIAGSPNIFPPVGSQIADLGTNSALGSGGGDCTWTFVKVSSTLWAVESYYQWGF